MMKRLCKSFRNAGCGILLTIRTERNMKIHLLVTLIVLVVAYLWKLVLWKWALLVVTIMLVLITEMFNTALEKTIDIYQKSYHPLAKAAKDIAAGAVLLSALMAVIMGLIIFLF